MDSRSGFNWALHVIHTRGKGRGAGKRAGRGGVGGWGEDTPVYEISKYTNDIR